MDYVTHAECEAKHAATTDNTTQIRQAIERIEARQWGVIVAIAGTLAMTVLNLVMSHVR